jgi:predicted PurR-regulated permease PerM
LLSVVGGVQALGPIGILTGPMVVVFLQTLLNLLHREISSMDGHEELEHDIAIKASD